MTQIPYFPTPTSSKMTSFPLTEKEFTEQFPPFLANGRRPNLLKISIWETPWPATPEISLKKNVKKMTKKCADLGKFSEMSKNALKNTPSRGHFCTPKNDPFGQRAKKSKAQSVDLDKNKLNFA